MTAILNNKVMSKKQVKKSYSAPACITIQVNETLISWMHPSQASTRRQTTALVLQLLPKNQAYGMMKT